MISAAYLAGILDADGHFTWRGGKYQAPDIGVTNTSDDLMQAITSCVGGSVAIQRYRCDETCCVLSASHIHRRFPVFKWHLTGYRAVLVCEAVLPHLVIKRERARSMIDQYHNALSVMKRPERRQHHMRKEMLNWPPSGWD